MPAQLTCDPIVKITLTSNEVFDEIAPGYVLESFELNKGLLTPNKFEFVISKVDLTLEPSDIDFELRDKLLAAMVEVTLKAKYYDTIADEIKEYEVPDFFYGYIQNIKVTREDGKPVNFRCTAYSPDAKMKHQPSTISFIDTKLEAAVNYICSVNAMEKMTHFDKKEGTYSEPYNYLESVLEPQHQGEVMPYTVQYQESPYNFLARLARRYAEFMYYENRKFVFGKMVELPEIHLHSGADLEKYSYEMNMNDHDGPLMVGMDTYNRALTGGAFQKKPFPDCTTTIYQGIDEQDGYKNEMAKSTYKAASDYFGDNWNSIYEPGAAPVYDMDRKSVDDGHEFKEWHKTQHEILERYVMADSLTCVGNAARVDLKLGSVIVIEDQTKIDKQDGEWKAHKPLKVIDLTYSWTQGKNLTVENTFKAIPQDTKVPPYLQRDDDGFLIYGDFDQYPKCGPHYGIVVDNDDPEHLGRVRVAMSWQIINSRIVENVKDLSKIIKNKDNLTPWIWVVSPYQGFRQGSLAIPEIGSMVLVGFEQNNAERPYVIGSRYFKNTMLDDWSQYSNNRVKGFRSRSGHTIEFIDAEGNNTFDGFKNGGRIHIYDADTHAYDILFDTNRNLIKMVSKGNIELKAGNDIIIDAGNDITVTAGNDMTETVHHNMTVNVDQDLTEHIDNDLAVYVKHDAIQNSDALTSIHAGTDLCVDANNEINVDSGSHTFLTVEGDMGEVVEGSKNGTFKKNLIIEVDKNASMDVNEQLRFSGKNIEGQAFDDYNEFSNNHNIKAQMGVKIDATSSIELKALAIKEN